MLDKYSGYHNVCNKGFDTAITRKRVYMVASLIMHTCDLVWPPPTPGLGTAAAAAGAVSAVMLVFKLSLLVLEPVDALPSVEPFSGAPAMQHACLSTSQPSARRTC